MDTRTLTGFEVKGAETGVTIEVVDQPGAGGANHHYVVWVDGETQPVQLAEIRFQNGPVKEAGVNGVTQEHLLAIVADRLRCFQAGPYPSAENAEALDYVEIALAALNDRTAKRVTRGVEGRTQA